jgi:hypothetical protein
MAGTPCNGEPRHRHTNIVITKPMKKPILLELVTSEKPQVVQKHFVRTSSYKDTLGAVDAWVIRFTCEDESTWQTEEQLEEGINVAQL